jgi:hypothetical protein
MTHTALLLALLASSFLIILPVATVTLGVIEGLRGWRTPPRRVRVAAHAARPVRSPRR